MVNKFFIFILIFSFAFGSTVEENKLLSEKIKTLIDKNVYEKNKDYINIIFSPASDYIIGKSVDSAKVIATLKENGLLNLFFKKPSELKLSFKTSGSPIFFIKIMGDTLRNIGYYQYVTKESNLDNSEFNWKITLISEYATDPLILQKELKKSGCSIVDIQRNSPTDWSYSIDVSHGYLNIQTLQDAKEAQLKRSLYAHWVDVSKIDRLEISSSKRSDWYPYLAYFDNSLHLLEVFKSDEKTLKTTVNIPTNAKYMKLSDLYTLKNIKDTLILKPIGSR